jgi:hydrogenase nickel incorporation protein HypB
MVLSKTDLLPYVSFDIGKAREYALQVHPGMEIVELSCKTGAGFDDWMKWLARRRESAKAEKVLASGQE